MLKLFTLSHHYSQHVNFNKVLKLLCHSNTYSINLCTTVPNDLTLDILGNCTNLKKLTFVRNEEPEITERALIELFTKLNKLKMICITYSPVVTDDVVRSIAENCNDLEALDVGHCNALTDDALYALCRLKNLRYLVISETSVTNNGVEALVKAIGSKIVELRMNDCPRITENLLVYIMNNCPELETLSYFNCKNINGNSLHFFVVNIIIILFSCSRWIFHVRNRQKENVKDKANHVFLFLVSKTKENFMFLL